MSINRDRKMVGDVQDRGALKWTALMLPEHIRMLREWKEEDNRVPKPELDEFDLHALQENIEIAIVRTCQAEIQVWKDNQLHYYTGMIISMDIHTRTIVYDDSLSTKRLSVDEITSVRLMD
ncbi:YolD-like family protein [Planococcus sp. A6]|uniref:YolD-like family protein n=1 Tax=Planococcus sp. A6 TaxID=2992760 RepID=UPI00237A6A7C|nr:YolD-like family protein [Planococcus sp. A6]MDE0581568.1 YolD-like family protein [Planococcus sp. A6]